MSSKGTVGLISSSHSPMLSQRVDRILPPCVRPWSTVPIQAQSSQPIVWELKPAKGSQKEARSLSLSSDILSIWDSFGKMANNGSLEMAGQFPLWTLEESWLLREEPTTACCKKWRVAGAKWASGNTQVKSKRIPWDPHLNRGLNNL